MYGHMSGILVAHVMEYSEIDKNRLSGLAELALYSSTSKNNTF